MEKPKYLKCIKTWRSKSNSVLGKIYSTEGTPSFRGYSWDKILDYPGNGCSNWKHYFVPCSEEEWNRQEGIITNYQIY